MKISSFIHPARTFLPCSGVGRHMNGVLEALARSPDTSLGLLFAEEWLETDGRLPLSCPLRDLPFRTFPGRESRRERLWKLINYPKMERYVSDETDWIYCPMETRLPVTSKPIAMTLHDVQPFEMDLPWAHGKAQRRNRRMWGMWLPKALREARIVFTVSEFSKQRIVELLGADPDKIVVSGNGVDAAYFREFATPPEDGPPYVLLVGGLRVEKGGRETLKVARILRREVPELRFRVVGEPNDEALRAEADAIGNFEFLGRVQDSLMPGLYHGACCLLFLSLYEGFGMPVLEAMACRTPVIAARRASIPEISGEAAMLFDPTDCEGIFRAVARTVNNPDSLEENRAKGFNHARKFTWEVVAERVRMALAQNR